MVLSVVRMLVEYHCSVLFPNSKLRLDVKRFVLFPAVDVRENIGMLTVTTLPPLERDAVKISTSSRATSTETKKKYNWHLPKPTNAFKPL
jgi:hypothetical protein